MSQDGLALAEHFSQVFREEHRFVRDALLDLIDAFRQRDRARIGGLLQQIAAATGPHFRYEEEALYPALVDIFGPEYVEQLYGAHDGAISGARRLVELAGKSALGDADVAEAVRLVRGILPHVSDCEGLSIMVERLPAASVQAIFDGRDRSLGAGLGLLEWAEGVRSRPAVTSA
ncbi:MAG: hemerythrin domain-containing protein [Chloroflexi bacterium]|nr:hemerythrin domain-containing protein [Chloroflexota bacterium]